MDCLDDVISRNEDFDRSFLDKAAGLSARYTAAEGDSLKWVLADRLYGSYYSYCLDSALVYLERMKVHALTPQQKFRTVLSELNVRMLRMDCLDAVDRYHRLDTSVLKTDSSLRRHYLSTGITLYHHLNKLELSPDEKAECREILQGLREKYIAIDSASLYGQKTIAQYDRDNGDYRAALQRLLGLYECTSSNRQRALLAYNIASAYELLGEPEERVIWLARSAEYDFRSSCKDYLSLYELALMLHEMGLYRQANKYIEINLADAFFGNFNSRFINSGKAHVLISNSERIESHNKMALLSAVIAFLVILMIGLIFLLNYFSKQRKRIRNQRNMLHEANSEIRSLNRNLIEANKIKDNYVFRYMELSVNYLDRCEDFRRKIRQIQKAEGGEAALKALRTPAVTYKDYEDFYKIFDEIFLGLFPDFVEKINSLLREEERFEIPEGRELRTELRMLAAIRIGITESGKISTFLKCSPTTIYTYRTRLHRAAVCSKEEFEERIKTI